MRQSILHMGLLLIVLILAISSPKTALWLCLFMSPLLCRPMRSGEQTPMRGS